MRSLRYATTQGSNLRLAGRVPGRSATHTFRPHPGQFIGCFYGYLGGKVSLAPSEVGRLAKLQASTAALEAALGRGLATPEQEITMADIALFPFLERAVGVELLDTYRGLSVAEFWSACPKLLQWYDRMLAVPAVAATLGTHRTAALL